MEEIDSLYDWYKLLLDFKLEQMVSFPDFTMERKAKEGEEKPPKPFFDDYKLEDGGFKEKEIFHWLYTLFESDDAIASFLQLVNILSAHLGGRNFT